MTNLTGKIAGILAAIALIVVLTLGSKIWEYNDAGNVLFVQYPNGSLGTYTDQGYKWQAFGAVQSWRKSNQFWFSSKTDQGDKRDQSVKIRFNDGAHATLSGSVRYDLPTDPKKLSDMYATFKTQASFEQELVRTVVEKSIYMTGSLMTSKESSAAKRPDLLHYVEDQAALGVYRTTTKEVLQEDELSGDKTKKRVTIVDLLPDPKDPSGLARQEVSPLVRFGVTLYNMAIDEVKYDPAVEEQIAAQQRALMEIQTAIATAKKSEQAALTAEAQGQADAKTAEWKQKALAATEIAKAEQDKTVATTKADQEKLVATTKAEQEKAVAELALETAKLEAQSILAKATAEAEGNKLKMSANGALEQKLQALVEIARVNAQAFATYRGNLVPNVVVGGEGKNANNADLLNTFLNVRLAESMKSLGVDLSLPQTVPTASASVAPSPIVAK